MGRARTIARRSFLIGSLAIAGGVAFGTYRYRAPYRNPLLARAGPSEAAITPYVLITPQGITLITPRADKGQGAHHVQAALIAEELDVELDQIATDPGAPSAAYWNQGLADIYADFYAPMEGFVETATSTVVDMSVKFAGVQITGGSTTVRDGFVKLRQAGASARETLKQAAAQKTGLSAERMKTRAGAVILPDGSTLPYTDLAGIAATLDPVQDVPLRDPSAWRLIGKPMQRTDIVRKSTGTQNYGIDVTLPGMLHATVLLAPAKGASLISYDTAEAFKIRGVRSVVEITGGLGIVADNTWRAFQAARAIEAKWGPAPLPETMQAHWQVLADSLSPDHRDSRRRDDGDIEAAHADARLIETELRAPYLAHAPLEPLNATVRVDEDSAEIWAGTQIPRWAQGNVSAITGIPADRITLHAGMIGGSFGHRLEDDVIRRAAEIAMQMKGTPVKLTYSRETDMAQDFPRQIALARGRGTVRDGKVDSLDLDIAMPSVLTSQLGRQGYPLPTADVEIVAGAWDQPFAIPHHRVTGYRAEGLAPTSSWRSVGASTNGFFYNAALDELIAAAGADPMLERLRLCSDPLARAVLEAVADMSGWSGPQPAPGTGRGVAFTTSFGTPCAEVVEVTSTDAGIRVDRVWVAAEIGWLLDPVNFDNNVKGGVIWGLGHAMNCELTYEGGIVQQQNYHAHAGMRLYQCPDIEVRALENSDRISGIGEPPVPPAAPALAAAIFAATGTRLREMPFDKFVDFV